MIKILTNTLICYLALIGLSTMGALFICLDEGYKEQCPAQVTELLAEITKIPQVNEIRQLLIPVIKQLPPNCISILIWSAILMATAFLTTVSYFVAKYTFSLLITLIKVALITLLISLLVALYFNYETITANYEQWTKYLQILNQ